LFLIYKQGRSRSRRTAVPNRQKDRRHQNAARITAGIVAGIGFIGAGTIWAEKDKVQGITTAASLWATAAIGLTTGIGDYPLATVVTVLVLIILELNNVLKRIGLEKD
jgi:uncharacterized membrane protein YhiD involved in acid resistance